MKFKVGDRVIHRGEDIGWIGKIDAYRSYPYFVEFREEHRWCMEYELELIQPEATSLPPDPIPGNYYRTRDGDKIHFVGQTKRGVYLYDDIDGDIREYARPFQYWTDDSDNYDIVAPWTDEAVLPAVEIKRWAVISRKDSFILKYYTSLVEAKVGLSGLKGDYEIVELVGVLPERKY